MPPKTPRPGIEKGPGDLAHHLLVIGIVKARGCFEVFPALIAGAVLLAAPLRAEFVYVSNSFDKTVSGYSVGSTGALTPIPGSPFTVGSQLVISLTVDAKGGFVFVTDQLNGVGPGKTGPILPNGKSDSRGRRVFRRPD
jgi:hypothetical protein